MQQQWIVFFFVQMRCAPRTADNCFLEFFQLCFASQCLLTISKFVYLICLKLRNSQENHTKTTEDVVVGSFFYVFFGGSSSDPHSLAAEAQSFARPSVSLFALSWSVALQCDALAMVCSGTRIEMHQFLADNFVETYDTCLDTLWHLFSFVDLCL